MRFRPMSTTNDVRVIAAASRKYCWICIALGLAAAWLEMAFFAGGPWGVITDLVFRIWPSFVVGIPMLFLVSYPLATVVGKLSLHRRALPLIVCPLVAFIV